MTAKFKLGDVVQIVSEPSRIGTITNIGEPFGGVRFYGVHFGGGDQTRVPETDLRRYQSFLDPVENLISGNVGKYSDFQRYLTFHRLQRQYPLRNTLYAINASRTKFFPYQFKPVIKILDSPNSRLLIADEVGLGKTIEAGLILTELRARQNIKMVLVVCPSNLCEKWRWELEKRFNEIFTIIKAGQFKQFLQQYSERPRMLGCNFIISLESIRQASVLDAIEAISPDFDLVIVDEAHHMRNFGRKQRKAGELLSRTASTMLLLTATPIHLKRDDLFSLYNILDPDEFIRYSSQQLFHQNEPIVNCQICFGQIPPKLDEAERLLRQAQNHSELIKKNPLTNEIFTRIARLKDNNLIEVEKRRLVVEIQRDLADLNLVGHIFTRTRKREVQANFPQRKPHALRLEFNAIESKFYNAVTDYVRSECSRLGYSEGIKKFILHMPQRRAASSIPAMVQYYRRDIGLNELDKPEDIGFQEEEIQTPGLDFNDARKRLQEIVWTWPLDYQDSKYTALLKMLRKLKTSDRQCKVIIFAFFKDTLKYLHECLQGDGFKSEILSGDVPPNQRGQIINRFRDDAELEVLLSSRIGGEGLDFQFCSVMVNYDLPWNPMEVEQRIGRLDRIGQESDVIGIYNFWIKGTIEEKILERLYSRIGIFKNSVGDLEAILGEEDLDIISSLERDLLNRVMTEDEVVEKIEITAQVIERRMNSLKELEDNSAQFIGTDQFFVNEINTMLNKKLYLTGKQLRGFVEDFLNIQFPRTRFRYRDDIKEGKIFPDTEFRRRLAAGSPELISLLNRGDLVFTFDADTAFQKPNIDFINALHPLTRAIVDCYKEQNSLLLNAHHIALDAGEDCLLDPGLFFYFIFRVRIHAARPQNTLQMMVIDENLQPACLFEEGEHLLGDMLERGQDPHRILQINDSDWIKEAYWIAKEKLHERIQELRKEYEKTNNMFVDRRLESRSISLKKQISSKKDLLSKAVFGNKDERYLRMLRGRIEHLTHNLEQGNIELEKLRNIHIEYDEIASGILEII